MEATRGRALSSAPTGNPIRLCQIRGARSSAAVAARRAAGHGLAAVVVVGRGESARAGAALISRCVALGEGRGERQPCGTCNLLSLAILPSAGAFPRLDPQAIRSGRERGRPAKPSERMCLEHEERR